MIYKTYIISLFFILQAVSGTTQESDLDILNSVLIDLVGDHKNTDIPVFPSLDEACRSDYIECDRKKIIGLDFQFANLNGHIPEDISKLEDLEYIYLEYNYLKGPIPSNLVNLKNLEEVILTGNFLTGPIPDDLHKAAKNIDLAENTFETSNRKLIRKLNIIDQINLEGRRSPDSIFINYTNIPSTISSVSRMPIFPGCEKEEGYKEQRDCSTSKFLMYIYKGLTYPYEARENKVRGNVIIQFIVLPTGEISNAKVVRDIGDRCGNSGLWIINRMNYTCEKWTPSESNGTKIKLLYTMPIKFNLK